MFKLIRLSCTRTLGLTIFVKLVNTSVRNMKKRMFIVDVITVISVLFALVMVMRVNFTVMYGECNYY